MSEYPVLAKKEECVGCMACVSICKSGAIHSYIDDDGHAYAKVDTSRCVKCLQCEKLCLSIRSDYGNNHLDSSELYAGWSNSALERQYGTSGGAFAAMARQVLKNGGVVIGAFFDGRKCNHKIIRKESEIKDLQGSKYVSSNMEGIYPLIMDELRDHKVLFSGVGCQCSAIINYVKNSKYKENLYTVDLVCGGMPSRLLTERFFDENPDIDGIVSFRTKDKYELKISVNGEECLFSSGGGYKNLPLDGFSCGMTNRYSCYKCPYSYAHRKSDITLGDLWNKEILKEQRERGISILLVHSKKGKELLSESDISLEKISWRDVVYTNKRTVYGRQKILFPRRIIGWAFKHFSYRNLMKMYCMDIKASDIPWMIYKTMRYILNKLDTIKAKQYLKKLVG